MSKNNETKIECIPDSLDVLHMTAQDAENTGNPTVTLRTVRAAGQVDFDLTPDAARELAEALNEAADEAEGEGV